MGARRALRGRKGPAGHLGGRFAVGLSGGPPEWIRGLVEANPEKVDEATYRQVVGAERPVFAVDRRSETPAPTNASAGGEPEA